MAPTRASPRWRPRPGGRAWSTPPERRSPPRSPPSPTSSAPTSRRPRRCSAPSGPRSRPRRCSAPSGAAQPAGGPGAERAAQPVAAGPGARPRALAAAVALVARGARAALVTADAAGAALARADAAPLWLPAPWIATVRNPVGAGDVLASALAAALERGEPLLEAARHGVAAAAASVESPTAGELDAARARELLGAVVAEPA